MRIELALNTLHQFKLELGGALKTDPIKANIMLERLIAIYSGMDLELELARQQEVTKEIKTA